MNKVIFKFNNGNGAILCSCCYCIIKTGSTFTEEEWEAIRGEVSLEAQYCSNHCKNKHTSTLTLNSK